MEPDSFKSQAGSIQPCPMERADIVERHSAGSLKPRLHMYRGHLSRVRCPRSYEQLNQLKFFDTGHDTCFPTPRGHDTGCGQTHHIATRPLEPHTP